MAFRAAVVLSLVMLPVSEAVSQGRDTMPRWGVEASSNLSASLLRFSNPARAWIFNVAAFWDHTEELQSPFSSLGGDVISASARLGMRFYRREDEKTRPFWSLSALLAYQETNSQQNLRPGAALETGVSHFFSKHVSLGFQTDLTVLYSRDRISTGASTERRNHLTVNLAGFRLLGGVYF